MRIRDVRIFASHTENASRPFRRSVGSRPRGHHAHMQARRRSIVVGGFPLLEQCRYKKSNSRVFRLRTLGSSPKCPRVRGVWRGRPRPIDSGFCVVAQPLVDARDCAASESPDPLPHAARFMERDDAGVAQRRRGQPRDGDAYRTAGLAFAAPQSTRVSSINVSHLAVGRDRDVGFAVSSQSQVAARTRQGTPSAPPCGCSGSGRFRVSQRIARDVVS